MAEQNAIQKDEIIGKKRVLTFRPGEEYKIKIETAEEFKDSLFRNIYLRAAGNLKSIIDEKKQKEENKQREVNAIFRDSYNNIIAFTGKRGTGKSSCMISFAKAIKYMKNNVKVRVFGTEIDSVLKDCIFEDIGVIDPSMFEEKDNILEIIIAKMFARFNERIECTNSDPDYHGKRELLKAFQKVYENLKTIQKEKRERLDGEVIETLSNLASGSNLKDSIIELVKKYLKFMGGENCDTYFLLVIDDFDLNIKHAGEMAEQIRKYLIIPRVIILLAAKLDQLSSIIEQTYREKLRTILDKDVKRMSSVEPQNMSYLYLEKLIPEDRRLYLTDIRNIENKDIRIRIEKTKKTTVKEPLEETILRLIYEKTGLIFLKPDYETHFLIPDNLRDLHSLYVMLDSLKKIPPKRNKTERKNSIRENIRRFEDYFFNTWIKNNFTFDDQEIIGDFLSVDIRQKNKFIITSICNKHEFGSTKLEKDDIQKTEFERVISKGNNPLNVSLGDVLFFLKKMLLHDDSSITKKFVFAIKTTYSLIFYKLLFIEENYENVQVLLGGSVYNPEDIRLIRRELREWKTKEEKYKRRDHFEVFYSRVKAKFKELTDESISELAQEKMHELVEWLHYFLIYLGKKESNYRKSEDKYYDQSINLTWTGRDTYATFDVLAFICFAYNPERLLQRIYEKDKVKKTSLCKSIDKWRDEYRAVLPVYSIEFLEKILQSGLDKFDGEAKEGYFSYFRKFFDNLSSSIFNIIKNHSYLDGIPKDAYDKCPIIELDDEKKKLLNELYTEKIQQEIAEFLNKWLKELKGFAKETDITLQQIKRKTANFLKEVVEYIGYMEDVYKKAEWSKDVMDKYKNNKSEEEKKAVLGLFDVIISLFEEEARKFNV